MAAARSIRLLEAIIADYTFFRELECCRGCDSIVKRTRAGLMPLMIPGAGPTLLA
jgi:hypothetical protein